MSEHEVIINRAVRKKK